MSAFARVLFAVGFSLGLTEALTAQTPKPAGVKNVVLVHGGFVDGSGWMGVYRALKKDEGE